MSGSGSLFGLVFGGYPARADGSTTKIAWRMTGSGPLVLLATDPDGHRLPATFGPEPHTGSNWSRPGDEWGSGFTFTSPGCWTINATRLAAAASLQVLVVA